MLGASGSRKAKGFTLIEVVVSLAIFAVLAGIILVSVEGSSRIGGQAKRVDDAARVLTALRDASVRYNRGGTGRPSFTHDVSAPGPGPWPLVLKTAGNFVILAQTGIASAPTAVITGNIGVSPTTGGSITGLACSEVTGTIYTVDAAGPVCRVVDAARLATAVLDMQAAYSDAAGRLATFSTAAAGNLGGLTLGPGVYYWGGAVSIPTDVTLAGSAGDVWIFQIGGALSMAASTKVILANGALPKNVFWQVVGAASLGAGAHMEGIVLANGALVLGAGASVYGRMLGLAGVSLSGSTVTEPPGPTDLRGVNPGRLSDLTTQILQTDLNSCGWQYGATPAANWKSNYYQQPITTGTFRIADGFIADDRLVRYDINGLANNFITGDTSSLGTLAIVMRGVTLSDAQALADRIEGQPTSVSNSVIRFTPNGNAPITVEYHMGVHGC